MPRTLEKAKSAKERPSEAERVAERIGAAEPHTASSLLCGALDLGRREEMRRLLSGEGEG